MAMRNLLGKRRHQIIYDNASRDKATAQRSSPDGGFYFLRFQILAYLLCYVFPAITVNAGEQYSRFSAWRQSCCLTSFSLTDESHRYHFAP